MEVWFFFCQYSNIRISRGPKVISGSNVISWPVMTSWAFDMPSNISWYLSILIFFSESFPFIITNTC